MKLSKNDTDHIEEYSKHAYENDNIEFECLLVNPIPNRDSFGRIMELCREKTCSSTWKCIKERSKSLDINVGSFRVTIYGKHYIEEYFKHDSLNELPKGTWCVIEKKPLNKYTMDIGCKLNMKEEKPIEPSNGSFGSILSEWSSLKKNFRLKNRYSFLAHEKYSIDLTVVRTGANAKTLSQSRTLDAFEKYEIEIEYVPEIMDYDTKQKFDVNSWVSVIEPILCSFRNTWKIMNIDTLHDVEKSYYQTLLKKDLKRDYLISNKNKFKISPNVFIYYFI